MTQDRGEQRSETARVSDDSDIIEAAQEQAPGVDVHTGSSGGNLHRDVATQAEQERATDPDAREGLTKGDQLAHGEHTNVPRTGAQAAGDRD